ncbi:unnamed protein product, partial [Amoebophrya sp. A25]
GKALRKCQFVFVIKSLWFCREQVEVAEQQFGSR